MKTTTVQQFFKQFPDDRTCVGFLMHKRYGETLDCPHCGGHNRFYRIKRHPAYKCGKCGYEIYPMKGTIFEASRTPLQKWFYAVYLFTTSRRGVSALELKRQLGVAYPTALKMARRIREHLADVDDEWPSDGYVEADEKTHAGGKAPCR